MTELRLPYGTSTLTARIDDEVFAGEFRPRAAGAGLGAGAGPTDEALVRATLGRPYGTPPLVELLRPNQTVVVVVPDVTRVCPTTTIRPPVLEQIEAGGVSRRAVTIVFATGSPRPQTDAERARLVGDRVATTYRCIDHDPGDCVALGHTTRGTPVEVFRPVATADRRVLIGAVELHYFAGYGGGAKAILPGCASLRSIQANHQRMLEPGAELGRLAGNPVREDMDDVLSLLPVDLIVNVVLGGGRIAQAFAGSPITAHRAACRLLDQMYRVPLVARAGVVVASPGHHPHDINLYQAMKAAESAKLACRQGGAIVLAAECPEGVGNAVMERWLKECPEPDDSLRRVREHFELGGHKVAALALMRRHARLHLVSALAPATLETLAQYGVVAHKTLQEAVDAARAAAGQDAPVLCMPAAAGLLPVVAR